MSCNVNNFRFGNSTYNFAQVTLTVDEQCKERWTSPGTFNMLASSAVYVGGASRDLQVRSHNKGAFIYQNIELPVNNNGCLRKVKWHLKSTCEYER